MKGFRRLQRLGTEIANRHRQRRLSRQQESTMKLRPTVLALALALAMGSSAALAEPFTFQGYVENAGNPINGNADMTFRVYSAASGGSLLGNEIVQNAWPVADGVFTIDLDAGIGLVFDGGPRFLEVEVNGQILSPRLEILPAPLAASANALRGRAVSASAPASGDVMTWTGTQWAPEAPSGGGGSYSAGAGLALAGTVFSVAPSYQLPQACSNGQVAKWNGSAWACAADADTNTTYSAGTGLSLAGTVFSVNFAGSGAASTAARSDHQHFGATWVGNAAHGLTVETDGAFAAVRGFSNAEGATPGVGLLGEAADSSQGVGIRGRGNLAGVEGVALTNTASGIIGRFNHATGTGAAVRGESAAAGASGVQGVNSNTGGGAGVNGRIGAALGYGVIGENTATTGAAVGVYGVSSSGDGQGVLGFTAGATGSGAGVRGVSGASNGVGVEGEARRGVLGLGAIAGVEGRASDPMGAGLLGIATAVTGQTRGVEAAVASPDGAGVFAMNSSIAGSAFGTYSQTSSSAGTAVLGDALATSGVTRGLHGRAASPSGVGVRAENTAVSGNGNALQVIGNAPSGDSLVVNANGTGNSWAIIARSAGNPGRVIDAQLTNNASNGVAIYSQVNNVNARAGQFVNLAGGEAARFDGNVNVVGNHTVSGTKSFRIDHPLDPENRYLLHYNLEGPEPFNLYRGTVKLDMAGAAEIELPEYFEAINIDLSYQLTAVGAAMPNLHVAREVEGNRFAIAGGAAGKRVSWQVTAVRNDPWVRDRGFKADVEKSPEEKGRFLYPEGYGRDGTKAIGFEQRFEKSEIR